MLKYLNFTVISLAILLSAISATAVAVAFPVMTSAFNTSLISTGWVLSVHQLTVTATLPLAGRASDALGRKFVFLVSVLLFSVGSLLCAVAPNITWLIVFRVIQAAGGGGLMPSAVGIVSDELPNRRQQAIGFISTIHPIGQLIGPNLGGWLVETFGWQSVFWINVPLGMIILLVAQRLLRTANRGQASHMDLTGAGLFIGSIFALMFALSELGKGGSTLSWIMIGLLFLTSLVFMVAFWRHEHRVRDPIIAVEVLKKKPFLAANFYNMVFGACLLGIFSLIPLYAVSVYNLSTFESGFILTPRSVGMIVASVVTSIFLMRWGYRWPIIIGTLVLVLSLFLLGLEPQGANILGIHLGSRSLLLLIMLLSGLGAGTAAPAANNACIELMPQQVATITGLRGMFRHAGGALSIAITTSLLQNSGDMARGFFVILLALAGILLLTIPVIFAMPRGPQDSRFSEIRG